MKINRDIALIGRRIVLVPYCQEHVERYHAWMQNKELLALTASEPLTLEEEYANCNVWSSDEKKLTWIILEKKACFLNQAFPIEAMVGDCNAFFLVGDDECEVAVMIAEASARRKGFGFEALRLVMSFIHTQINKDINFVAKIDKDNIPSIKLFEEKLCFEKRQIIEAFSEVHFSLAASSFDKANYAVVSYKSNDKKNLLNLSVHDTVTILSSGPNTSITLLANSLKEFAIAGPALFEAGEPAVSSLLGHSDNIQTIARHLAKASKRFIAVGADSNLCDDTLLTHLTTKAILCTPPAQVRASDYPIFSPFDADLSFDSPDALRAFVEKERERRTGNDTKIVAADLLI